MREWQFHSQHYKGTHFYGSFIGSNLERIFRTSLVDLSDFMEQVSFHYELNKILIVPHNPCSAYKQMHSSEFENKNSLTLENIILFALEYRHNE